MVSVRGRSGIFTGRAHGTPDRLCAEVISVMFGKNRRKSCLAGLPFLCLKHGICWLASVVIVQQVPVCII